MLAGTLLAVAHLPGPAPGALLVFVAIIPLVIGLERAESRRAAARVGAAFGVVFWGFQLSWVLAVPVRIGAGWPVLAWAGQVLVLSLMTALMGVAFVVLRGRRVPVVPAAVVAWIAVEWARGSLLGPLSFPWTGVALPLARLPALVQPAAWGGEMFLSAGVVTVNALLASWVVDRGRGAGGSGGRRPVAGAAALLGLWVVAGVVRLERLTPRLESGPRAVVVQPAVSLADKRGEEAARRALESMERGLAEAEALLPEAGEAVVVFPETHLPLVWRSRGPPPPDGETRSPVPGFAGVGPLPVALLDRLADWSTVHGTDVLIGAYGQGDRGLRNTLLHIGPAGVVGGYDKIALVPGVERAPGGLVPGEEPRTLDVPGRAGPLICIESAWSSLGRAQARAGAGWLLNVTNDAWLGEGSDESGMTTPAFHQHPWHLVLRSVETGLGAIRVGNNGWTGSVDPLGRWTPAIAPHRPGVAAVPVARLPGQTAFVRVGNLLGPLSLLLVALAAFPRPGRATR